MMSRAKSLPQQPPRRTFNAETRRVIPPPAGQRSGCRQRVSRACTRRDTLHCLRMPSGHSRVGRERPVPCGEPAFPSTVRLPGLRSRRPRPPQRPLPHRLRPRRLAHLVGRPRRSRARVRSSHTRHNSARLDDLGLRRPKIVSKAGVVGPTTARTPRNLPVAGHDALCRGGLDT